MNKAQSPDSSPLFNRIDEEKQERILAAAIEEFAAHGYTGANVNRIAQAADISVGALYKYFSTKDALFLYIVEVAAQRLAEHVNRIVGEDIRLLSKIEKLLRIAYEYSETDPALIKLYNVFMSENDTVRAEALAQRLEGITAKAYTTLLAEAQSRGEIRADIDPGVLAYMLDNQLINMQFSFACNYYQKRFFMFVGEKNVRDREFVIHSMMRVIESMLGTQPETYA